MILYHGTVDTFVKNILKNGLKPKPSNAWHVAITVRDFTFRPDDSDREPAIYLSPLRSVAKRYAINKAKYYAVKPNGTFPWTTDDGEPATGKKLEDELYLPGCKPVLLKCTIPASLVRRFQDDYKASDAYLCTCTIPPECIEVVA